MGIAVPFPSTSSVIYLKKHHNQTLKDCSNSMSSQDYHQQAIFGFASNGFERSSQQQQQIQRDKMRLLQGFDSSAAESLEEERGGGVYETAGMLSEMFNFADPSTTAELLETARFRSSSSSSSRHHHHQQHQQHQQQQQPQQTTSENDNWYGNNRQGMQHQISSINVAADSAAAMQLFLTNPSQSHQTTTSSSSPPPPPHQNSSTLHMLLPNPPSNNSLHGFPNSGNNFGHFTWGGDSVEGQGQGPGQGLGQRQSQGLSLSLSSSLEAAKAEEELSEQSLFPVSRLDAQMSDIRKWFMKSHEKTTNAAAGNSKPSNPPKPSPVIPDPEKTVAEGQTSSVRRKTSKYFDKEKSKPKDEIEETQALPAKRKTVNESNEDDGKKLAGSTPTKKLKSGSGRGILQKPVDLDGSDEDDEKDNVSPIKSGGRGRGGRGASTQTAGGRGRGGGRGTAKKSADLEESDEDDEKSAAKSGGRGRGGRGASTPASGGRGRGGGGRGGFMNFGERKDPPHKGEKEVPVGAPNCLAGLTFVISGTLDSLEREEAEDLIKRHGGRVTGSISKKTNYLLCDEDIGGRKSEKAKELGTSFLTEDGLFDMIRASKPAKAPQQDESKKSLNKAVAVPSPSKVPLKAETKASLSSCSPSNQVKPKKAATVQSNVMWTEKHRPTNPKDIIGNQSLVLQLRNWLKGWHEEFSNTGGNKKGKKQNDSTSKKAVLLSGTPGIGKTTSAKLVCQELGFQAIEVNASDSRGKADSKIEKGISGSNSNSIKELVTNEALGPNMNRPKKSKTVLIMDEVDGMSAGDRGGVADLIASIKISKIPIICICNDRYSQKLKSLVNYCLLLSYRKPTKQQMAKKFNEVATAERLEVNQIALEELAERVNGDMRMALNQLQYMGLSMSVINYDDIRQRLLTNAKDEDISPFTAVDKLFGVNAVRMRMDERFTLSMSDPDLVPLLIQENYVNFRPSSAGKDADGGIKRMQLIARAAESIADGDIVNVQIRRYRQWQLSQTSSLASCIIPTSLLHGQREVLEQGERNFNRFGGWLGKNSTRGKNMRLMDDLHVHILASRESSSGRDTIRLEYLTLLLKKLTEPLKVLPKAEAVEQVVEFMNTYSISQEDYDTIVELSKFKGHPNPLDGILPAVKSALTKAYKEQSKTRMVRAADLITLPGIKKAPKKRIAAILEPADEGVEQGDGNNALDESEEENNSDADGSGAVTGEKLKSELQSLSSKGMQVQLELKGTGSAKKASGGRGKAASASGQKVAQTAKAPAKRKR